MVVKLFSTGEMLVFLKMIMLLLIVFVIVILVKKVMLKKICGIVGFQPNGENVGGVLVFSDTKNL